MADRPDIIPGDPVPPGTMFTRYADGTTTVTVADGRVMLVTESEATEGGVRRTSWRAVHYLDPSDPRLERKRLIVSGAAAAFDLHEHMREMSRMADDPKWQAAAASVLAEAEHPAPWRVDSTSDPREGELLLDANGRTLIEDAEGYGGLIFASARVRALVDAAPRMEALLRDLTAQPRDDRDDLTRDDARRALEGARALLAELDAAKDKT